MTVLHVIEPFASGITTFVIHLARQLPHHKHVVVHGGRTSVDTVQNVRRRFPAEVEFILWAHAGREVNPFRDVRAFFSLIQILRKREYDVVHMHSSKAGFLGRMACFFLRIKPVIYTPNAAPFLRRDVGRFTRWFFFVLEWIGAKAGGIIVACCNSEREAYRKRGLQALCINNGTIIAEVDKSRREKIKVICSALMTEQKNPELFNVIALAFEHRNDIEFTWIGDGPLKNQITAKNVSVTGWLGEDAMKEHYRQASIYLSTSRWEGLPFSVLEAMNAGLCPVLTACDGHLDQVVQEKNGYLFTNSEEGVRRITSLLDHPERIVQMGKESAARCRDHFDVRNMAGAYEQQYRKIIDEGRAF